VVSAFIVLIVSCHPIRIKSYFMREVQAASPFRIATASLHCAPLMTITEKPTAAISTFGACCLLLSMAATPAHAMAQQVGREQEIVDLKLGQRVQVDDGTCPTGEIKEVSGARMTANGIQRTRKCIPRFAPKPK
jgi:hypothetical protein